MRKILSSSEKKLATPNWVKQLPTQGSPRQNLKSTIHNPMTYLPGVFSRKSRFQSTSWLTLLLVTLSLTKLENRTVAQTAANAPQELQNTIARIDAAASQHNVNAVMQFYSQNFTHSDGLTRQSLEKSLTQLWQRYPQLKYQTQLQSWKAERNAIMAETVTNITGTQSQDPRNMVFNSTIRSRQRYENGKIVRQEILSEQSQIQAGAKPPTVRLNLPQQVKPGEQYNFDAIVQEPLGDDYLLGAALEEPIKADNYLNPTRIDLELLSAGGVFKVGRAPSQPQDQWISAVLIRGEGMTWVTQRLNVVGQNRPTTQKPAASNQRLKTRLQNK